MALPPSLGIIAAYQGDPLRIIITAQNQDLTSKTFTSQVRASAASSTVVTTFSINVSRSGSDTVIILSLTGDSKIGIADGQTRLLPSLAYFDVEQANAATGILEKTYCTGQISLTGDVTR